jgi:glycosyltransferase involved in cell wall biosynthesis
VPGIRVVCSGGGTLGPVMAALSASAGVDGMIDWLGHREDMPTLYAAADIVCLPSRAEGLPLVVLEAMAAGRAVVAARAGGVPEAVLDGVTGVLVDPGDVAGLADAVVALLTDDAVRSAMGRAARVRALERFRAEDMVARLESVFASWIDQADLSGRESRLGGDP